MMRKQWIAMCVAAFLVLCGIGRAEDDSAVTPASKAAGYIDTHMHLSGKSQRRQQQPRQARGMIRMRGQMPGNRGSADNYVLAADNLVAMMDRLGIEQAVVMPPPQVKNQQGGYTYQELLGAIQRYPGRLILAAGGGELSPMIMGTQPSEVTKEMRAEFRAAAAQIIQDGAKAFGEMAVLHYSFNKQHPFEQAPADHPLFLLLADLAAYYNVPIDIHMEAVPEDIKTPDDLLRRSSANPALTKATIPGFERLLRHNRGAKIVWAHVGWDNTGYLTVDLLRQLLLKHANLYCSIKFVRQKYEPFGRGNKLVQEPGMQLRQEWLELLQEYPDRFMVGADEFVAASGQSRRAGPSSLDDTWSIIRALPQNIRDKVGRDNACRVYNLGQ